MDLKEEIRIIAEDKGIDNLSVEEHSQGFGSTLYCVQVESDGETYTFDYVPNPCRPDEITRRRVETKLTVLKEQARKKAR